ncbi:MAG: amino acid transporter, partial [Actinomycetota bacterium]|nr:amino acid transporter [Actinomycetota bacterium]
ESQAAVITALVIAGVSFIAVLLIVSLLLLAVDPAQVTKQIDKPVLYDESEEPQADDEPDASASGSPKA